MFHLPNGCNWIYIVETDVPLWFSTIEGRVCVPYGLKKVNFDKNWSKSPPVAQESALCNSRSPKKPQMAMDGYK